MTGNQRKWDMAGQAARGSRQGSAMTRDRRTMPVPRQTVRTLTGLGLTPEEAANLTAFLCGIPLDGAKWSLRQVNQLLFLRELRRTGRFGPRDGRTPRAN